MLCTLLVSACDSAGTTSDPLDEFRAGTDDTTDDDTTDDGAESWPVAGENFGPCHSDPNHIYRWCDATPGPFTLLCAAPQEDGSTHASVCVERRGEGDCPAEQLLPVGGGLFQSYKVEQDYWHGCSLSCLETVECPAGMICASDVCAWPTF